SWKYFAVGYRGQPSGGAAEGRTMRGWTSRRRRAALTAAILSTATAVAVSVSNAPAATLTWDSDASAGNGATDGGGTWDTTTQDWFNGSTDVAWINANNDTAIF